MAKKKVKRVVAAAKPQTAMQPAEVKCSTLRKHLGCLIKGSIIFTIGAVVGATVCCTSFRCPWGHGKGMFGHRARFEKNFINGCLDTSSINNAAKLEKIQLKDADKNGCITEEEFFGAKKMDNAKPKMDGKLKVGGKVRVRNR